MQCVEDLGRTRAEFLVHGPSTCDLLSPEMASAMVKEFVFYYDVICPYAYLASRLVEDVAGRTGAVIKWRPVLLGRVQAYAFYIYL